jgi:hypothetical protein
MAFGSYLSQLNAFFRPHSGDPFDSSTSDNGGSDNSSATPSSAAFGAQSSAAPLSLQVDLFGSSSQPAAPPRHTNAQTIVGASGGLRFDFIWDNSVANAPSQYKSAIEAAASFYTKIFSTNELITVHVGWGEVDGRSLGADALGENIANEVTENYSTVYHSLQRDAGSSSVQASADATLTASSPLPTNRYSVSVAQAQAWGLLSANNGRNDGWMGLANDSQLGATWDFSRSTPIGSNQFDAIGTAEHELTELMGRYSNVGNGDGYGTYTALDLFRYSAPGKRDLASDNGKAYFSINKGVTDLGVYNNNPSNGDLGDWVGWVQHNSYGDGFPGEFSWVTKNDLIEDAVLGYKLTAYGKTQV